MINWVVLVLAVIGLIISWYIGYKKKKHQKLVCVIGDNCNLVTHSKYSHIFGIPLENLGILYYVLLIALILVFIYSSQIILGLSLFYIIIVLSIGAVLFSAYLTYVQLVILKNTCDYCLASATVAVLILIIELL